MSSVIDPQPEPSPNDELVAYLDGELPPDECRRVEDRLAADDGYRQQLRDLDQAWEALSALPSTAVDDSFARTTIELACVAAEEDLSQRTAEATAENRGRKRWWIGAGVAAAVIGFVMMRALAVHRNNTVLADLPVIVQVNTLAEVPDVDFLRQLAAAVPPSSFVGDTPAFVRTVADFTSANSASLDDRRAWVNSLSSEQKVNLAERSRAFEELRQNPRENDRLRKLARDISLAPDADLLQRTLVAYGQWLSQHKAGEQQTIREDLDRLSTTKQKVDAVQQLVRHDNEQAARRLSPAERDALRSEIFALAKEKKPDFVSQVPAGPWRVKAEKLDASNPGPALFILRETLRREAFQNNDEFGESTERLLRKINRDKDDGEKLSRRQRDRRRGQLMEWIHEAVQTKLSPEDLERFFESDKLTNTQRQTLLNKPKAEMEIELEQLYLKSELGIERLPNSREFDGGRGPRNGPGPGPGPEGGPFGRRPEGPPPEDGFGPGPPDGGFDRDRPPGPDGRRGPPRDGPDDRRPEDRRPGDRPRRPPNDRRSPDGPPPPGQQPPPPLDDRDRP